MLEEMMQWWRWNDGNSWTETEVEITESESEYERITDSKTEGKTIVVFAKKVATTESTQKTKSK